MAMRRILALLGLLLLAAACRSGTERETAGKPEKVTAADVRKEAAEALDTAGAFLKERRDQYRAAAEARLRELDTRIEAARGRARAAGAGARERLDGAMQDLARAQATARRKMAEFSEAGEEAGAKAKERLDRALDELDEAYGKLRERLE